MLNLFSLRGRFVGHGVNHEGQPFTGIFDASPVAGGRGVAFSFQAIGSEGTPYHIESSLIGKGLSGKPTLFVVSSNHPGCFERSLASHDQVDGRSTFVFKFGRVEDRSTFREEIRLEILENSIKYVYCWGMPGGDFAERSGCMMKRVE